MTNEERILIAKLNTGELDGVVGDLLRTSGGSTVWTSIKGVLQIKVNRLCRKNRKKILGR